jgi:hypothetical protein
MHNFHVTSSGPIHVHADDPTPRRLSHGGRAALAQLCAAVVVSPPTVCARGPGGCCCCSLISTQVSARLCTCKMTRTIGWYNSRPWFQHTEPSEEGPQHRRSQFTISFLCRPLSLTDQASGPCGGVMRQGLLPSSSGCCCCCCCCCCCSYRGQLPRMSTETGTCLPDHLYLSPIGKQNKTLL